MKKLVIINLIFFFSIISYGQEIKSYNLDIDINVKLKQINVKGTINIDFENRFLLIENNTIEKNYVGISGNGMFFSVIRNNNVSMNNLSGIYFTSFINLV